MRSGCASRHRKRTFDALRWLRATRHAPFQRVVVPHRRPQAMSKPSFARRVEWLRISDGDPKKLKQPAGRCTVFPREMAE